MSNLEIEIKLFKTQGILKYKIKRLNNCFNKIRLIQILKNKLITQLSNLTTLILHQNLKKEGPKR